MRFDSISTSRQDSEPGSGHIHIVMSLYIAVNAGELWGYRIRNIQKTIKRVIRPHDQSRCRGSHTPRKEALDTVEVEIWGIVRGMGIRGGTPSHFDDNSLHLGTCLKIRFHRSL